VPPDTTTTFFLDVYIASAKIGALIDLALADADLPADTYALQSLLVDEGPATPTELAARTGIALSTVVFRTRKMIEQGLVERIPHPADGRSYLLSLTVAGKAAHARARPLFRAARRAVEVRLDRAAPEIHAGVTALIAALDAEIAQRRTGGKTVTGRS
jgi:DNA-binding MarR family transcriptional regulator